VGKTVHPKGMETGIAKDHFQGVAGSRIPLKNDAKVGKQCVKHRLRPLATGKYYVYGSRSGSIWGGAIVWGKRLLTTAH
jgi:hypothetical protein